MTLHIDYPTELCFLLIDAIRDRVWRQPELDLRLKIAPDETGRCALEVVCAPERLHHRRAQLKILDHSLVATFFWTPERVLGAHYREGWSVGECRAFLKMPRPPIAECDSVIERFWTHVVEHCDEKRTH